MLPPKLKREAEKLARHQGLSLAELIRDSLERRLAGKESSTRDPLFANHFAFRDDGPADVAANPDRYVAEIDEKERQRERGA